MTLRFAPALGLLLLGMPMQAQMDGFSKPQLIKYTSQWRGPRFDDGRPKVPAELLERLRNADTTSAYAAWGPLRSQYGYLHQWEGNWLITHPAKRLVGRVFTCQYMPGRPEVANIIEGEHITETGHNERVIDMLQENDVIVVDMAGGRVEEGIFLGDNLATGLFQRTHAGFIINGSIRDKDGIESRGITSYSKGVWPGIYGDLMLTGINVPIRVGNVTVMPGDVVVGDGEGVTFLPPQTVSDVVDYIEVIGLVDDWRQLKFIAAGGKYKPSELYGRTGMRDPALQKECEQYVMDKLKEKGLKPVTERKTWHDPGGCFPSEGPFRLPFPPRK